MQDLEAPLSGVVDTDKPRGWPRLQATISIFGCTVAGGLVALPDAFQGVGLHSGQPARMTIRPAMAEHGIWFKRTDIRLGDAMIPAIEEVITVRGLSGKKPSVHWYLWQHLYSDGVDASKMYSRPRRRGPQLRERLRKEVDREI